MQPDLSQGHPGVQGSMFGGAALQGGGYLRQSLLHTTGRYWCRVNRTWRQRIKPSHTNTSLRGTEVLTTTAALGSHVPQCRVLTQPNTSAGSTDSHKFREKRRTSQWNLECLGAVKRLWAHIGTQFPVPAPKPLNQSTPFHTLRHTVLWPWMNQVKMN